MDYSAKLTLPYILPNQAQKHVTMNESLRRLGDGAPERDLHVFLGLAPRRLGKADLAPSDAELAADRLCTDFRALPASECANARVAFLAVCEEASDAGTAKWTAGFRAALSSNALPLAAFW